MISNITCSGGGPLIALPSEIAADWRGTLPPIGANVPDGWRWGDSPYIECDYDRACGNIEKIGRFGYDYFGVLSVNNSKSFVFTCEQVISFKENEQGGILIGNFHQYDALDQFLATVDDNSWTLYTDTCELKEGKLYIFDSAFEGYANAEEIRAYDHVVVGNPGPGKYNVYHQNTADKVGLLKFVRI